MNKKFVDQVESTARLQFKLFDAEIKLEEMVEKVKVSEVSEEVKQKLFDWINEMRPNLMTAIALKEIQQ